jgi:protein-S-isoprenylcysteine O-methyltransferase Ste14
MKTTSIQEAAMLWVKVFLLFLLFPGIADVLLPGLILLGLKKLDFAAIGAWQIVGLVLIAFGLFLVAWVCQAFVRGGKGTPAPFDPPRHFVSEGLYRWTRNPMYLGAALFIPLGEACFFKTFWLVIYAALLMGLLHIYVTNFEEPSLVKRFGRPYQKYLHTVPRWIPRKPGDL